MRERGGERTFGERERERERVVSLRLVNGYGYIRAKRKRERERVASVTCRDTSEKPSLIEIAIIYQPINACL